MSGLCEMYRSSIRRWRVQNYHREQLRNARHDRDACEHVDRASAGIRDYAAGGI